MDVADGADDADSADDIVDAEDAEDAGDAEEAEDAEDCGDAEYAGDAGDAEYVEDAGDAEYAEGVEDAVGNGRSGEDDEPRYSTPEGCECPVFAVTSAVTVAAVTVAAVASAVAFQDLKQSASFDGSLSENATRGKGWSVREVNEVRVAPWYLHGGEDGAGVCEEDAELDPGSGSGLGPESDADEVDEASVGDDGCRRDGGTRATAMATG